MEFKDLVLIGIVALIAYFLYKLWSDSSLPWLDVAEQKLSELWRVLEEQLQAVTGRAREDGSHDHDDLDAEEAPLVDDDDDIGDDDDHAAEELVRAHRAEQRGEAAKLAKKPRRAKDRRAPSEHDDLLKLAASWNKRSATAGERRGEDLTSASTPETIGNTAAAIVQS